MSTNYSLKISTPFTEKEIAKATRVFDCDEVREYLFEENNFKDKELSLASIREAGFASVKSEGVKEFNLDISFISHTIINLNVSGASAKFVGRYKAGEQGLCDVSCIINHNASSTDSSIDLRGISESNGKIISRSSILIKENLKNINGKEDAKFIFVENEKGETGEIDAIPSLDISSHEVSVTHAMSISKIKDGDIWYSALHGIGEEEAKREFINSFLK